MLLTSARPLSLTDRVWLVGLSPSFFLSPLSDGLWWSRVHSVSTGEPSVVNYILRDIEGLVNCSCSERLSALRLSQCSPNVHLPLPLLSVPASVLVPSGSLSLSLSASVRGTEPQRRLTNTPSQRV